MIAIVLSNVRSKAQSSNPSLSILDSPHPDGLQGPSSNGSVDQNAHEQVSLPTGTLSLYIPILSIPQRGGRSLDLGYVYSSNTLVPKETSVTYQQYGTANASNPQTWFAENAATVTYVEASPVGGSLHSNVPLLTSNLLYAGYFTAAGPNYYASYCVSGWTFTDWQGASHSFRGYRDCTQQQGTNSMLSSNAWTNTIEAVDDSGYRLDTSDTAHIKVVGPDGMVYVFTGYTPPPSSRTMQLNYYAQQFSSIIDPNGNVITNSGGTITDTVGRKVALGQWTDQLTPTSTPITLGTNITYSNSGDSIMPPTNALGACSAKAFQYGQGPQAAGYSGIHLTVSPPPSGPSTSTTRLTLPDQTSYTLTYDSTNRLIKVQYPAGGYTRYDYDLSPWYSSQAEDEGDMMCTHPRIIVVAKHECTSASGNCTASPQATATSCQAGYSLGGEATTCYGKVSTRGYVGLTLTKPDLSFIEYSISTEVTQSSTGQIAEIVNTTPPLETQRQYYQSGVAKPIRTVSTAYGPLSGCPTDGSANCNQVASDSTIIYNDTSSTVSSTTTVVTTYPDLITSTKDKDFAGNTAFSMTTSFETGGIYALTPSTSGALYHILDHPKSIALSDGVTGLTQTSTNTHDSVGNLVQVDRAASNASTATTHYVRDGEGNITSIQDPLEYAGVNSGATGISYTNQSLTGCPENDQNGQPTLITDALNHTQKVAYSPLGRVSCKMDTNNQTTKLSYDQLGRLAEIDLPDGGQTAYSSPSTIPFTIDKIIKQDAQISLTQRTVLDGFGRPSQSIVNPSSTDICTATFYDALGRVSAVNDPQVGCSTAQTSGSSRVYSYDALSRLVKTINQDGTFSQTQYTGPTIDAYDELNHHSQRQYDFFGRLTDVFEPDANNSPSFKTHYNYDGFGNLDAVTQTGLTARSFTYDGFSRLLTSNNPERGAICYGKLNGTTCNANGYDLNGNVIYETDNRGTLVTFKYDVLNRLISQNYSAAGAPSACFQYDKSTNGSANGNLMGRLTSDWTQAGSCNLTGSGILALHTILGYDPVGRVLSETQCARSNCPSGGYNPQYSYDLLGHLITRSSGLPSGAGSITFTSSYDTAGRMAQLTSNNTQFPVTLLKVSDSMQVHACSSPASTQIQTGYSPAGLIMNAVIGNGIQLNRGYDSRLRFLCQTNLGTALSAAAPGAASITITGAEQTR